MPTRTLLCQTASKYYQIESDLTKYCQNYMISSNLKIMPRGPPCLQRQRRVLRTMFLIFAFAQLRADDLKNTLRVSENPK